MVAAFLAVNPFVNLPFDDDWSYSFTVRQLLSTGHITYNGWSAPILVTHALWGAMFCKMFGYSFIVLRFSTLPLDIGVAVFAYLLARSADLRPAPAMCLSLMVCISPLFLPLALSFMTDVPGLFYTLASLYALMRAGRAPGNRAAIIWLAIGVLVGIAGGMGRQIVWIAPLCIVPYLIALRWSNRTFVAAAIFAWLVVVLDICICMRWFARQPDVYFDPSLSKCVQMGLKYPKVTLINIVKIAFTTVLFTLPVALPFAIGLSRRLWSERKSWRSALTAIVVLGASILVATRPAIGLGPWLPNIVTTSGVLGGLEISGDRPTVFPLIVTGTVSAIVLIVTYLLLARAIELAVDYRRTMVRLRNQLAAPDGLSVLTIFCIFYFGLMVIRAGQDLVFDRYCLPLIVWLGIVSLRRWSPAIAWPALVVFAVVAVAVTQDNFALLAARKEAIDRLEAQGVPRTQIAAGFEYNFYTQLEEVGRINRYNITNPTRSYDEFDGYTPALKCKYRLEFPHFAETEPSPFGEIRYISWLWPFHRVIFIDQFKNPWWIDPKKRTRSNGPTNFEMNFGN